MTMTTPTQEIKTFYDAQVEQALENCQTAGYQAVFMPQLADARMQGIASWNEWRTTPSIRATGRTKQGNAVVVYAHIPNWLANPDHIRTAKQQGLVNYAARLPQDEFQRLLGAEDKQTVFVVDHAMLRKESSGTVKIAKALQHPQTIPFLGGEERAERYLKAHAQAYNTKTIGNWHGDDLNEDSPLARLLCLDYYGGGGLGGGNVLGGVGQFFGVRQKSAEGARSEKSVTDATMVTPTLDDILRFSTRFVPYAARKEYEDGLRELYQQ